MTVLGESFMQDPILDCEDDIREHLAEHITQQCPPLLSNFFFNYNCIFLNLLFLKL